MPKFGAHMSIAGGVSNAFDRGVESGCETMQIFTSNNRQWNAHDFREGEVERFHTLHNETGIDPLVSHTTYLINIASPKGDIWNKSFDALVTELCRCDQLGIPHVVLHPGSHTGAGVEGGIQNIARAINRIHAEYDFEACIALEITAGQGTSIGSSAEDIARILEQVERDEFIEFCFDTCHALAAGYDLTTDEGYTETFDEFERLVGLDRLTVFHFNDSKGDLGSNLDRHTHIGCGNCGLSSFRRIVNDERFGHIPMILETPKGGDMAEDVVNLRVLRGLVEGADKKITEDDLDDLWADFDDIR